MIPWQLQNDPAYRFCLIPKYGKYPVGINDWQDTNNHEWNDQILQAHIAAGKNYGVVCGLGGLLVLDFDKMSVYDEASLVLGNTFTVRTGSGRGTHMYFITDEPFNGFIDSNDGKRLIDIQGPRKQVVGPGSIHETGGTYTIMHDVPIKHVTKAFIKSALSSCGYTLAEDKPRKQRTGQAEDTNPLFLELKKRYPFSTVLSKYGIDASQNPTQCPLGHASMRGKCFSFDDSKGVWYCFHCHESGNVFQLIGRLEKLTFSEVITRMCKDAGINPEDYEEVIELW